MVSLPADKGADTSLVLKVDVDTAVGLTDGVRRLADIMAALGITATYFISMGPDNSGRALKRVFRPGFLRKQLNSGAAGAYGPLTMCYGILLPAPIIARKAPGLFNRLVNEGHEVGLHGWDHVFWHDRLKNLSARCTEEQLDLACGLFREVTGFAPATFASPGWQITETALSAMVERGISHVSCTRGAFPFRPLVNGHALPILELPTNLPSMDEILGSGGVGPDEAGAALAEKVIPGRLNVFTMHAEVEGRHMAPAFTDFCRRLQDRGVRFLRLVEAAKEVADSGPVPVDRVCFGPQAGRAYDVSWQESVFIGGAM